MGYPVVELHPAGRWPADVTVWHVAMPAAEAQIDRTVFDDAELEHAARYRQRADRLRYLATRAALRERLGARLGRAPGSLRFAAAPRGRPELVGAHERLSFNVSHSGEHALIALSTTRTVGVDVERIDPALNWQELVDLVCTGEERRMLAAGPDPLRRESFFRCWTAKEALLKALGLGITEGLQALAINPIDPTNPTNHDARHPVVTGSGDFAGAAKLRYQWLTEIAGYLGCLAFGEPWEVRGASSKARPSGALCV